MTKIKILPEILSNKIAAGEVVERPSSVVKELVENALDAESTRIIIEVENGGRSLIRVSDNGIGMNRDDALLALERYATSKIYEDRDLFSISTLGFRGEALPSIASVSRFSLVARDESTPAGTEIIVEGGTIKQVSEVGAPAGTMITVKQLFFNTPARRKFLKTTATEMGHITDSVASIALGRPEVHFKLHHNNKIVKSWPAVSDPLDRVSDVLGSGIKNDLHKIESSDPLISVFGWTSSPRVARRTSRGIYIYVNGRFVRDRVIQHALFEGYAGRLMKGQFPLAVLFVKVPPDRVDVNVHPTKQEVRFAEQRRVHETVAETVSATLKRSDRAEWSPTGPPREKPPEPPHQVSEPLVDYHSSKQELPLKVDMKDPATAQAHLWDQKRFSDLRVIGQFHNTYILCESNEELFVIDQHAAHERILYEQLKDRSLTHKSVSQKRLVPETVDFGYRESTVLEALIPDLKQLGLEIEPFGGNTFVVKSVPALLEKGDISPLVIEIVEKMVEIGFFPGLENAIDQCLMLMACHGAVRANQPLADKEIEALLNQLDACDNPSHCPHGRPTWIRWSKKDLEKAFGRIS
ncbi:DNA mismatch repair endonuclease MutL [Thermodesulfobacteriota bacterium]